MAEKITSKMIMALREVETALMKRDYAGLSNKFRESRLSEEEIRSAIKNYGGTITRIPDEKLLKIPVIRISGTDPIKWAIDLDLWMDKKPTDLTVSIILHENNDGNFIASIDDIHVL